MATTLECIDYVYDASDSDYSAVVYMRNEATNRHTVENSAREKTRVAPIRRVTLPRDKTHGDLHSSKTVQNILALYAHFITCWCDSEIALAYGRRLIAGRHNGIRQIGHQSK
ncbi:hypothetical protein T07_13263 [Trichinella nelsoni]|uniref:Uncharacterized protein n=1 Tax=Trichinella nelsoni TaxID=6336 RepID=A0A0V0SBD4_9BILA|nr:hypothetical protein T07_13263 [Trichinella nelsoni]